MSRKTAESLISEKQCCKLISQSFCDIVRYSTNEEFRRKVYHALNTDSTGDSQIVMYRSLKNMLEEPNPEVRAQEIVSNRQTEKKLDENEEKEKSEIKFHYGKNWLELSSQKFRESWLKKGE